MLSKNLDKLYFSQSALATYESCPLKFRRRYLDGLFWPRDWGGDTKQKEVIETGKLFHRLAQRYYTRGEVLEVDILSSELKNWFDSLRDFRMFNKKDDFYPEHEIRINRDNIKLVAKFDLLYLDKSAKKFIIYDWKTNKKPFSQRKDFMNDIQTIVYLFVLFEGGEQYFPGGQLLAKDISLVYWNPRFPRNIKTIEYNNRKYRKDREYLIKLISEIKMKKYDEFPGIEKEKICKYCEYCPICFGKKPDLIELIEEDLDIELDWEAIDEIQF